MPPISKSKNQWTNMFVICFNSHQVFGDRHVHLLVKIVKVLGEGGFSFVYLVQDELSGVGLVASR